VLSFTVILLLPLVIIFTFVVLGLARGDESIQVIRDIVLSRFRRSSIKDEEKDISDEDSQKK
jgi:hypothetical protein